MRNLIGARGAAAAGMVGQPNSPASKKARQTINCLRPSNRSIRLTLPLGPSNTHFFSTAVHGSRRHFVARASQRELILLFHEQLLSRRFPLLLRLD